MSANANTTYPPATGYPQGSNLPPEMTPPPPYVHGVGQSTATAPAFSTQTAGLPYAPQPYGPTQSYPTQSYPTQPPLPIHYGTTQGQAPFPEMPPPQYPKNTAYASPYNTNQEPTLGSGAYIPATDSSENIVEDANWTGFSEKAIRNAFIRKVYAILMLQLTFTVAIICLFVFEKRVNRFVQRSVGAYVAAYITFLAVYIALVCCQSLRRKYPTNIILLSIFTMAMTYLVATISSYHDTKIVLMGLGICAACCLGISIFSCFTKFDFTSCAGVLFVLSWVLFLFGIIAICTYKYYPIMQTVYAGLGALVFMLFLAFDTQMVMGGKKYALSPEEHIFAALQLYLDIVYIFLFILTLLGGGKK